MSVKITYFVHGTTNENEANISSGQSQAQLSKLGIQQSLDLKEQIDIKDFDIVFCSDLDRAVDSAKLTFDDIVDIKKDKRLRECNYGIFNGKDSVIVEPLQKKHIYDKFEQGESYEDVLKRITNFINFLKKDYNGKKVAIIAHKAPQYCFQKVLENKSWEEVFEKDWRKIGKWQPGWDFEIR